MADKQEYGPYIYNGFSIRRRQRGRMYDVAIAISQLDWEWFCKALDCGMGEVEAVFAIDSPNL